MSEAVISSTGLSEHRQLYLSKFKAFSIHLFISALVISVYLLLVFLVWYPSPYYMIEKVWDVISIVVGVFVLTGPLLTFIVYKAGKATLKLDLSIIVAIQLSAFLWGVSLTYHQRPVYTAIVEGVFRVVSASEVDVDAVGDPALKSSVWSGPKLVYVDLPYSDEEFLRIGKENLSTGQQFAFYTQYYRPFMDYREMLYERAIDIRQRMSEFADLDRDVKALVKRYGGTLDDYVFMSVEGRVTFGFLVLRRDTGEVVTAMVD